MNKIQKIETIAYECMDELYALGIEPNYVDEYTVNTRAKSRWGQTKRITTNGIATYRIDIADCLVRDDAPKGALKETVMHEIIHCVDGCFNHGENWKRVVAMVNKEYGYHIGRTDTYKDMGFETNPLKREHKAKYRVICNKCNHKWDYERASKTVQICRENRAKCSCGGKSFTVIDLH